MSSDWQDTNTKWQEASSEDDNLNGTPRFADLEDQVVETDPLSHDVGGDAEDGSPTRLEVLWGHMRQLSPVLAPLLFGGATFLFILPFILNNRAYLSTVNLPGGLILLAIGVVLLIFALAQGIMLYYANNDDVLWSLGMACGFSLFLLTGCFAIFGLFPSIILLVVLGLLGYVLTRLCVRPTPEGQVDIVESFGKHSRTLFPGLNFVAPWEKVVSKLDTRLHVWTCPLQRVLVSRSEEVQLAATISYQLMPDDAHYAVLYVKDWEKSLQELLVTTVQEVVGNLSPEDVITWSPASRSRQESSMNRGATNPQEGGNWDHINLTATIRMQEQVAQWGVQVNEVHIRDVALVPHIPSLDTSSSLSGGHGAYHASPVASAQPANQPKSVPQTPPAASVPNQAPSRPKNVQSTNAEKAQPGQVKLPAPAPTPPPAAAPTPASTPAISKAETLTEAYEAVRSGRITDPDTIREIAARFERLANDPEESQAIDFDAARAARSLRDRAMYIEEQANTEPEYDNGTRPDWSISRSQQ